MEGKCNEREYRIRMRVERRKRRIRRRLRVLSFELIILIGLGVMGVKLFAPKKTVVEYKTEQYDSYATSMIGVVKAEEDDGEIPNWVNVDLIDEGNPSRTGLKLDGVNNIVVHYVGNPGTTAEQNRNFYNQQDSNVCSHFVVGIDGTVILCVPLDEQSAASNHRNHDTISVEVCHPDETGEFTDESYASLVKLVDWLLNKYDLEPDDVIRHYDVTGKLCPLYYVEHPDAWEQFKEDL